MLSSRLETSEKKIVIVGSRDLAIARGGSIDIFGSCSANVQWDICGVLAENKTAAPADCYNLYYLILCGGKRLRSYIYNPLVRLRRQQLQ